MKNERLNRMILWAAFVGCAAAAAVSSGCYQRVTRASGLGADRYQISEPYQENSKLDDWVFGPRESATPMNRGGTKLK